MRLYAELTARDSAIVRQVFGVGTASSSSSMEEGKCGNTDFQVSGDTLESVTHTHGALVHE